mgnify:CR=1 FL=1
MLPACTSLHSRSVIAHHSQAAQRAAKHGTKCPVQDLRPRVSAPGLCVIEQMQKVNPCFKPKCARLYLLGVPALWHRLDCCGACLKDSCILAKSRRHGAGLISVTSSNAIRNDGQRAVTPWQATNGRVRFVANPSKGNDGMPCIAAMRASKLPTVSVSERSSERSFLFGNECGSGYQATSDNEQPRHVGS